MRSVRIVSVIPSSPAMREFGRWAVTYRDLRRLQPKSADTPLSLADRRFDLKKQAKSAIHRNEKWVVKGKTPARIGRKPNGGIDGKCWR